MEDWQQRKSGVKIKHPLSRRRQPKTHQLFPASLRGAGRQKDIQADAGPTSHLQAPRAAINSHKICVSFQPSLLTFRMK